MNTSIRAKRTGATIATTLLAWIVVSAPTAAMAQVTFESGVSWNLITPQSAALADFNEDGHTDIVVASLAGGYLEVRYGLGDGNFSVPLTHTASTPYHVHCPDVNGDGHIDIVSANMLDSSYSVLLGDGTGHFSAVVSYDVGGSPIAIASGDFDEDGDVDLAVANLSLGEIQFCAGDGLGSFAPPTTVATMADASFVITLDLNQDQHLDLVVTSGSESSFGLFFGDGNGGFSIYQLVDIGVDDALWDIAARDVNGDQILDLILPCPNLDLVVVYQGSPFGGVQDPTMLVVGDSPQSTVVCDVNGDGYRDVASANMASGELCVNIGDGSGGFTAPTGHPTGMSSSFVKSADLDEDGRLDFVVCNQTGSVQVVLNRSIAPVDTSFIRGDVDGNGSLGIGDAILGLDHLFAGVEIDCPDAADASDDGSINLADSIYVLSVLFGSGAGWTGTCELDTTIDLLGPCTPDTSCFDGS
ncbi:MAG: FG-GAP-like repeat-containing protein [Planctomycetota bacterium]